MDPIPVSSIVGSLLKDGFVVVPNTTKINKQEWQLLRTQAISKAKPIFNLNADSKSDCKRRQSSVTATAVDKCLPGLTAFLKSCHFSASTWMMIVSDEGCQRQAAHTDFAPTEEIKKVIDLSNKEVLATGKPPVKMPVPLSVMVALEEGTFLDIWRGSCGYPDPFQLSDYTHERIQLKPGEILLFRGDLVHAGAAYSECNVRLHAFLDVKGVPRQSNSTFLLEWPASDLSLQSSSKRKSAVEANHRLQKMQRDGDF